MPKRNSHRGNKSPMTPSVTAHNARPHQSRSSTPPYVTWEWCWVTGIIRIWIRGLWWFWERRRRGRTLSMWGGCIMTGRMGSICPCRVVLHCLKGSWWMIRRKWISFSICDYGVIWRRFLYFYLVAIALNIFLLRNVLKHINEEK